MYAILIETSDGVIIKLFKNLNGNNNKNCKIFYNPNFTFKDHVLTISDKNDLYEVESGSWKLEYVDLNFNV